ncbi:MAG TPA: hypothetical protein VNF08_01270 [Acidimicrobiales bacterium]|nr:hypothetical protein [Acidimicrobiales bacterium]
MTDDLSGFEEIPFDPATMATSSLGIAKAIWYKRPWFLLTVVIVFVVAVSVISDLSRPITKAQDASSQNATIKAINSDIKECAFAVNESFNFYNDDVSGKLTPSELSQTTKLLVDDRTACSFASQPVYDLTNNIQPTDTKAGKHIDRMKSLVVKWITDYALASIDDIQYLFKNPGRASKIRDLSTQEAHLSTERQFALNEVSDAQKILGMRLATLKLPVLPHLIGT